MSPGTTLQSFRLSFMVSCRCTVALLLLNHRKRTEMMACCVCMLTILVFASRASDEQRYKEGRVSNENSAGGRSEVGPTQASTRIEADLASRERSSSQTFTSSSSAVSSMTAAAMVSSAVLTPDPDTSSSSDKAEKKSGKFRLGMRLHIDSFMYKDVLLYT